MSCGVSGQTYIGAGNGCSLLHTLRWRDCDRWQRGGRSSEGLPEPRQAFLFLRGGRMVPAL